MSTTHIEKKYKPKPPEWFIERIGKRVYRDPFECCDSCKKVESEGLIVGDENHAAYLAETDADFGAEGIELNYRDKL